MVPSAASLEERDDRKPVPTRGLYRVGARLITRDTPEDAHFSRPAIGSYEHCVVIGQNAFTATTWPRLLCHTSKCVKGKDFISVTFIKAEQVPDWMV